LQYVCKVAKTVPSTVADYAGELLKAVKDALSHMHDRDALMALAFKGIGGLPLKRIQKQRAVEAVAVEAMLKARGQSKRKADLKKTIAEAQAIQDARFQKSE
jgi:hypothetical protein